mmetsp:Transcript_96281/g.272158  ORF Transcript_96281/g.272158 Transcript_96281/m.272158 type:complete len:359 (-) Transcript_96281:144-1220(-)
MFEWCEGCDRLTPVLEATFAFVGEADSAGADASVRASEGASQASRHADVGASEGAPQAPRHADVGASKGASKAPRHTRVLVVGCGTSGLSAELWDSGRRQVHSIDVDEAVIAEMRDSHQGRHGLTWQVLDITTGDGLDPGTFDLAVDKGTLDYIICGGAEGVADALRAVHAALTEHGVLLLVSIHPLELLRPLFATDSCGLGFEVLRGWSLSSTASGATDATDRPTGAIALRRAASSRSRQEAIAQVVAVLDAHFGGACPLLTAEREIALRRAFVAGAGSGGTLAGDRCDDNGGGKSLSDDRLWLPIEAAHSAMFPLAEEQAEYPLELFLEDLRADETTAEVQGLTLAGALDFLRRNQ